MEKNKLGLGILIGILSTLVIVMGVFIVYDKVLSNDNNDNEQIIEDNNNNNNNNKDENQDKKNIIEVVDINSNIIKNLTDVFVPTGFGISSFYSLEDDEYAVSEYVARGDGLYVKDSLKSSDLNLKTKLEYVYISLGMDLEIGEYYTEEQFKNEYKKLFGLEGYDTLYEVYELKYDESTNRYVKSGDGGGNETLYKTYLKVLDAKNITTDTEKKLEINVGVVYGNINAKDGSLVTYLDYQRLNRIGEYNSSGYDNINWNNKKYSTYKLTFKYDNAGNYIFSSIDKQK